MRPNKNHRQWEAIGRLDPFWGMTGTHKFGAWDQEAFLQTGDRQVAKLMQDIERFGRPRHRKAVLDFGCGVGRLARGFCDHFDSYTGLDISHQMVAIARQVHADNAKSTFAVSTSDTLKLPDNSFDLVNCWAVLQHIPDRASVLRLLAEFIRVLRKDGLLHFSAMHHIKLPYRLQPRRRLYALLSAVGIPDRVLYNRLKLYPQEVHFVPQTQVVDHLQAAGAHVLDVRPDAPPDAPHQVRVYYVTK